MSDEFKRGGGYDPFFINVDNMGTPSPPLLPCLPRPSRFTWKLKEASSCQPRTSALIMMLFTLGQAYAEMMNTYSHLSNSRGGWNKRGGGAKVAKSIDVEVGTNVEGDFF